MNNPNIEKTYADYRQSFAYAVWDLIDQFVVLTDEDKGQILLSIEEELYSIKKAN